jgi:transposase InsO family protein
MKTTTSTKTIEALRMIFCRTGIPKQIVSDNGPQFTSGEFENFTKQNGIKHYKSAPFHPATNGLVERFVQTFKNSMRAMKQDNKVLSHKIANFLVELQEHTTFSDKRDSCEVIYGKRLTFMLESSTPVCKRHCDELSDGYCISKV